MTAAFTASDRLWIPERRPIIAGVLGLITFVAFESFAITTALPVVARSLAAEEWYSFAFAGTVVTGLIGMTVGGSWADARGPVVPLKVGGALLLTGIALCAAAPGMPTFIAGRLLQGLGAGITSVVLYVVVAVLIPEHLRARMFGLFTTAWLLPSLAGPMLTGVIVETIHWRAVFVLAFVGSLVALASLLVVVAHRIPANRGGGRIVSQRLLWAALAAAAVFTLHIGGQQPALSRTILSAGGTALVLLAVTRLLPAGTLIGRTGIPRFVALRGLLGGAAAATDIYLTLYLQNRLGYSPITAGAVIALGALGWAAGAWIQGRSTDKGRTASLIRIACALVMLGPVTALAVVTGALPVGVAVAGCIISGIGMGIAFPQLTSTVLARTPTRHQGENSAALQLSESLGISVLLALTGGILAAAAIGGFSAVYIAVSAAAALALALALAPVR